MLIMLMLLLLKCNLEEKPEVWVFPEGGVARKSFQVSVQISASDSYDDDDYDDDDVFGDDDDASSSRRVEWRVFPGCNSDETYYEQTFPDQHESRFGKLTDILGEPILLNLASEHRPGWLGA